MARLFQHLYRRLLIKQSWDLLVPVVRFEKLLWRLRFIIMIVKKILTIHHPFLPLNGYPFLITLLSRLICLTTKHRQVTMTNHPPTILISYVLFLVTICIWLSDVTTFILIVWYAITLTTFCIVQLTLFHWLGCLVVYVWDSYDGFWAFVLVVRMWRVVVVWTRL